MNFSKNVKFFRPHMAVFLYFGIKTEHKHTITKNIRRNLK